MNFPPFPASRRTSIERGFTLIELLTVIAIIGILMALLFPAIGNAMNQAKKAQAKTDVMQAVTAVKSFFNEYSRYPESVVDASTGKVTNQAEFIKILRAKETTGTPENTRAIPFFEPKEVKGTAPKGGVGYETDGQMYDPWGMPYIFVIDYDSKAYDNIVKVPDGVDKDREISTGAIGMSLGKNKIADTTSTPAKDDVGTW